VSPSYSTWPSALARPGTPRPWWSDLIELLEPDGDPSALVARALRFRLATDVLAAVEEAAPAVDPARYEPVVAALTARG
jgi:hypothetical protein